MIRVGITGGIGSGKSRVCGVFSCLGIPVYHTDEEARILIESDEVIRQELIRLLGTEIFSGKTLNRTLMSRFIFENSELLKAVNGIVHPRVAIHFDNWCSRQSGIPYVMQESAILFESGSWKKFDVIILVTAPETVRMERVLKRQGMTMEKIRAIVKNQLPEEEKIVRSHYVFFNDDSELILPGIVNLHETLTHPTNR